MMKYIIDSVEKEHVADIVKKTLSFLDTLNGYSMLEVNVGIFEAIVLVIINSKDDLSDEAISTSLIATSMAVFHRPMIERVREFLNANKQDLYENKRVDDA